MKNPQCTHENCPDKSISRPTPLPPIVLIDDDPNVLETLKDICESLNCSRLVACLDTKSAFDAVADPSIGLIVCDYRFPNASGVSFIGEVRQRGIETPVLFISGTPDTDAVLVASQLRNTAFLGKPFTIQRFRDAITKLMQRES